MKLNIFFNKLTFVNTKIILKKSLLILLIFPERNFIWRNLIFANFPEFL